MRRVIILLIATCLWAEGSVNVTVDRHRIDEGDSITLMVTAKNVSSDPDIVLPKIPDFKVVTGSNQESATNIQFINGKMTKSSTTILTWVLIPTKTGKLMIPAMSIKVGKQTFKSAPIAITVNKRGSSISKFFIEAEIDNGSPFRGEQVTLTYTLYTQVDVTSFDEELPKYKGFWTEEVFSPKKLSLREVQKNGVRYYAATIKKLALFPTQSGEIHIDPMTAVIGIREKQQRWNDFSLFGPPSKKFTFSTNTLKLDVQPLPTNSRGKVSPVVGNWDIRSSISSTNIKQDAAVTFKVIVSGTGNIQAVDITDISFPNELEVFEPEIQVKDNPLRDKIGGEKQFEWVLIPRFAGDIYIPKVEFIYFDPRTEKWMTQSTSQYHLNVAPNEKISVSILGLSKEEISLMREDIRFLDKSKPKWRDRNRGLFSGTALTLLLLSGVVFVFPNSLSATREKLDRSSGNRQARRALKSALKILDSPGKSPEDIYTQIYKAVVSFMNHKTGSKKVEYSNSELLNILKTQNLDRICPKLDKILSRGEAVRFAPVSSQDAHTDLTEIKQLLEEANREWP